MQTVDSDSLPMPEVVDREAFETALAALRVREKARTHEGDAIAASRRRLPMVEVGGSARLVGRDGALTLLDAFEGRRMLLGYYFMWYEGQPAARQCEGCTWVTAHMREFGYLHTRDVTFAVLCEGPYPESARYRDFMGWTMPWYSAQDSLDTLLGDRDKRHFHLICYLQKDGRVFETYWTTGRGVEAMQNSYPLLDLTVYGRQESWEDSPEGWPRWREGKERVRTAGRPIAQWERLRAGVSDDLT